jgi:hypothetical protein
MQINLLLPIVLPCTAHCTAPCVIVLQEYDKAMETYRIGLSHDPDNEELLEGVQRCMEAISRQVAHL